MNRYYVYSFDPATAWEDIESALLMALWATEGLHGLSAMHLESQFSVDADSRACQISAATEVGANLNRIFTSLLLREFGEESFKVNLQDVAASHV